MNIYDDKWLKSEEKKDQRFQNLNFLLLIMPTVLGLILIFFIFTRVIDDNKFKQELIIKDSVNKTK